MTNWQASANWQTLLQRSAFFASIREFFTKHECLEVQVPILQHGANLDHGIEPLQTTDQHYLISSPEHYLKRLLCKDGQDCYSISPCFRANESGKRHNPEFYMLEWYRLGMNEKQLAEEVCLLIEAIMGRRLEREWITYRQAFLRACNCDPFTASSDELKHLISDAPSQERNELLDLIMLEKIEASFNPQKITILHDYPANQAAQARCASDKDGNPIAHRFEIYFHGMELANGYWECTDAEDIRQRMRNENPNSHQLDEAYLAALDHGLPDCAGVALGLDRLFMIQQGINDIKDVIAFPQDRQT